jgi:dihydrofolate reductase
MRKITFLMHTSLDGFVARPGGELDWVKLDDEMFDFVHELTNDADTALYGRVTWQMMDEYWPEAGTKANATKHDKEHSTWYNEVEKYVLSNSMKDKSSGKTHFVDVDEIRELKNGNGSNILMLGSPSAFQSMLDENLIDEFWFFMNPIILGEGISLYKELKKPVELVTGRVKTFTCGATAMNFSLKK